MPTVLIVDDTDSDRKLASKVVSKAGHSILSASSGTEALHYARPTPARLDSPRRGYAWYGWL